MDRIFWIKMKSSSVESREEMKKECGKAICVGPQGEISGYFCLSGGQFLALLLGYIRHIGNWC